MTKFEKYIIPICLFLIIISSYKIGVLVERDKINMKNFERNYKNLESIVKTGRLK